MGFIFFHQRQYQVCIFHLQFYCANAVTQTIMNVTKNMYCIDTIMIRENYLNECIRYQMLIFQLHSRISDQFPAHRYTLQYTQQQNDILLKIISNKTAISRHTTFISPRVITYWNIHSTAMILPPYDNGYC